MRTRAKSLRETANFTQEYVAAYLHCDQSLYSKYERGTRELPLHFVICLARLYHTSIDYIMELTDEPAPYPPAGG